MTSKKNNTPPKINFQTNKEWVLEGVLTPTIKAKGQRQSQYFFVD